MNRLVLLTRWSCLLAMLLLVVACAGLEGQPRSGPLETEYEPNEIAQANLRLGVAYMEDGNNEKALEKLERARQADPRYPLVYNMLGLLYQRMGVNDQAEKNFKQGLNLAPNNPNLLNNFGQFLCNQGRVDEAESAFVKASENPLNENPDRALTNAGTCGLINDNNAMAEKYYRRALEENPRQSLALLRMANLQYDNGEYLSARGYLQRFAETTRHNARSLWLGVRIERELGNDDRVSSYALSLRSNFPDSDEARLLSESGIR